MHRKIFATKPHLKENDDNGNSSSSLSYLDSWLSLASRPESVSFPDSSSDVSLCTDPEEFVGAESWSMCHYNKYENPMMPLIWNLCSEDLFNIGIYLFIQTKIDVYLNVCETQRTRMHATDTAVIPNGHQMAVVPCNQSIVNGVKIIRSLKTLSHVEQPYTIVFVHLTFSLPFSLPSPLSSTRGNYTQWTFNAETTYIRIYITKYSHTHITSSITSPLTPSVSSSPMTSGFLSQRTNNGEAISGPRLWILDWTCYRWTALLHI